MAWEILKHVELSNAGATLDSGTFTAKKNLKVIIFDSNSGAYRNKINFNSNSGSNYAMNYSRSGATNATEHTQSKLKMGDWSWNGITYHVLHITNIDNEEKFVVSESIKAQSGVTNVPNRTELTGKFTVKTGQITSIQVTSENSGGAQNIGAGSYITVLGAKEPATASNLEVGSFTAKDYYHVEFIGQSSSGSNTNVRLIFNSDDTQTSKYSIRESSNNGDNSTNPNLSDTDNLSGTNSDVIACSVNIMNTASPSTEPVVYISEGMSTSGIGANPNRKEVSGKFIGANTITKIKATTSSASWKEGSRLTVWGSDGASDTIYPTLVGGYIFEETDTGKHFMFDGTSTWTEIS